MALDDPEEGRLRDTALQNARSILLARQRAELALERKTEELAHSLAMIRATLESTTDGILVTDADGRVTDFNQIFVDMWGVPQGVMDQRTHVGLLDYCSAMFDDPERFRGRVAEVYATSPPRSDDVLQLRDGRVFERYTRPQVIDGRNVGRVWSFRDVTARRRAEQVMMAAKEDAERANRAKDEFLAVVSHELRTPLTSMLGWARVLNRGTLSPAEAAHGISVIERNVTLQTQLIEDLLDVSRIATGKLSLSIGPVDVIKTISAAAESTKAAAEAKQIRVEVINESGVSVIAGDADRLQQVFWNLLSNAVKFTPKGGHVEVRIERHSSTLRVTVADSGQGIRPDFLPYVFDRFRQDDSTTTRRYGGLGLGLAIVRHLVEQHGGRVSVTSPGEGQGASFRMDLPIRAVIPVDSSADVLGTVDPNTARPLTGIRVVVVEDEADSRDLVVAVLDSAGAVASGFASAIDALDALEHLAPDVVVSDIGMPDKDGFELIRELRARPTPRRLPVLALTAYSRDEDRIRALTAGFDMHAAKPIDPVDLVRRVRLLVGR